MAVRVREEILQQVKAILIIALAALALAALLFQDKPVKSANSLIM